MCAFYDLPVSTHSRLKAAGTTLSAAAVRNRVSTHSRLKAAGWIRQAKLPKNIRFNTQPPEGGWRRPRDSARMRDRFNTQPPEGGWNKMQQTPDKTRVSTHSRLKAAGSFYSYLILHG